jgi:hypothetical protein
MASPHLRPRLPRRLPALLLCAATPALAQTEPGQDTRLRLDQQLDRQSKKQDADTREQAAALDGAPASITLDGETYAVGTTADDIGRALYAALSHRQWADVRRFLAAYEKLAEPDPLLVDYARGALARQDGHFADAERAYRGLLAARPDFLPGQLELARLLFEDHKDREARAAFEAVRARLAAGSDQSSGVLRSVELFLAALRRRSGWQGSIAIGPGYSSNLNQSSASYTCLFATADGNCLFERTVPDPVGAPGVTIEAALSRRFALAGHGGLRARTLLFGDVYPGQHVYSQGTLITRIGYEYQTAHDTLAVSPTVDLGTLGSSLLYHAAGVNAEWTHGISPRALVKLEGNYRRYAYPLRAYRAQDGDQADLFLTGWYGLPGDWLLLGGGDMVDKRAANSENAYRQWGARLGVSKSLGHAATVLLIGATRWRAYGGYSETFEAKRSDREQVYTGIARFPSLELRGLVPELLVQHTRVTSNIDWLYSWHRTTASLRLSHVF